MGDNISYGVLELGKISLGGLGDGNSTPPTLFSLGRAKITKMGGMNE